MKRYLLKDVSYITNINDKIIDKLSNIAKLCICDYINELDIIDEDVLNVDIGIGIISMLIVDDEIQYSFSPSTILEEALIKTIEDKESPLINKLEVNLEKKINSTYKDIV